MAYIQNEKGTGLDTLTTLASGDLIIVSDVSDSGRAKAITEDNFEDTTGITQLKQDVIDIQGDITNIEGDIVNLQTQINNISGGGGGGVGGKPMTFSVSGIGIIGIPEALMGYVSREAIVFKGTAGGATRIYIQDASGFIQTRNITSDWAAAENIQSYALVGSFLYIKMTDGAATNRIYRYAADDLATGGTIMTFSGGGLGTTGDSVMASNGVDLFLNYDGANSANSFDVRKYTISGTVLTNAGTVTLGADTTYFVGKWAVDTDENYYGFSHTNGDIVKYDSTAVLVYTSEGFPQMNSRSTVVNWTGTMYISSFTTGEPATYMKVYLPGTDIEQGNSLAYVTRPAGILAGGGSGLTLDDNTEMHLSLIDLDFDISVTKLSFYVNALTANGTISVILYSFDGTKKIFDFTTGTISTTGQVNSTVSTPQVISRGQYYLAVHTNAAANLVVQGINVFNFLSSLASEAVMQGTLAITASTTPTTIDPTAIVPYAGIGSVPTPLFRFTS